LLSNILLNGWKCNKHCLKWLTRFDVAICSILDMVRRNNYRILNLLLKLPTGFKQRDLDVALVHAVKAGFFDCAKVLLVYYYYYYYYRQGRS